MPHPRTPTVKMRLLGAYEKNPQRARDDDVFSGEFPAAPPAHLSDEIRKCWLEIVSCCAHGVLQRSDQFVVEIAAALLCQFRRDPDAMLASRVTQLRVNLAALGMSPADRSRLSVPEARRYKPSSLLD